MGSSAIFLLTILCVSGGIVLGSMLRNRLPEHHLSADSKEIIKITSGLIATLVALVLGLLVGSSKSTFDAASEGLVQDAAKIIILYRAMERYGPETDDIRNQMRSAISAGVGRVWHSDEAQSNPLGQFAMSGGMDNLIAEIRALAPANDIQRSLQSQMLQTVSEIQQSDWLLIEQNQVGLSPVFLFVLIFWLSILFMSFAMLAPQNVTAISALLMSAICTAGAIFLIVEMSHPFDGLIKVPAAPLQNALAIISK